MRLRNGPNEVAHPVARLVVLIVAALLTAGCSDDRSAHEPGAVAEQFIDAFYAWDEEGVSALVAPGEDLDRVLYYQGWARGANYEVLERRPCASTDGSDVTTAESIQCAITVSDDFGQALGYRATDTFSLTMADGKIVAVSFAGDDPPVFEAVFAWMAEARPEVFTGPCLNMFEGGTTPQACSRAVADAARAYAELFLEG